MRVSESAALPRLAFPKKECVDDYPHLVPAGGDTGLGGFTGRSSRPRRTTNRRPIRRRKRASKCRPADRSTKPTPSRPRRRPQPSVIVPKQPPDAIDEAPAGPEAGGRQRRVDSRLLGLGRRAERFSLDQRLLARAAAEPPMGARPLATGRRTAGSGPPASGRPPAWSRLSTCPRRRRPRYRAVNTRSRRQ